MNVLFRGIGASRGRATGRIVFSSESARPGSILVRIETSHEDAATIRIASGVICTRGGITSDAAIVARTLAKPCVVGCPDVRIDYTARTMTIGGLLAPHAPAGRSPSGEHVLREGDTIEIDGATGEVGIP